MYKNIESVPTLTLAALVGRWIAIAQIECNAGEGRQHAVEQHALAAAAVYVINGRGCPAGGADLAIAVDNLGSNIRNSYRDCETVAEYPPGPAMLMWLVQHANYGVGGV